MQSYPQESKNAIEVLELLSDLQAVCGQLQGEITDYAPPGSYLPKRDKTLWSALSSALAIWMTDVIEGSIAGVGTKNYNEAIGLCHELSTIKCEANIKAQLVIAEALGLELKQKFFGLSWKKNCKEIKPEDIKALCEAINIAMIEVFLCIAPETLEVSIMRENSELVSRSIGAKDAIIELIMQTLRTLKAQQDYDSALSSYRCSRMDVSGSEPSYFNFAEYPDPQIMLNEYSSLFSMCQKPHYKKALSAIGIGKLTYPIAEGNSDFDTELSDLIEKIERAFFEHIVTIKTHEYLIDALTGR